MGMRVDGEHSANGCGGGEKDLQVKRLDLKGEESGIILDGFKLKQLGAGNRGGG